MDIEQTLRLACMPPEPGRDFEDTVMARVSAAAWRAAQLRSRRSRRVLLVGSLLAVAAAAATFATWNSGSQPAAPLEVQTFARVAPSIVHAPPTAAAAPATPDAAPAGTPPAAPKFTEVAQQCSAADAAPSESRYTVLVQPVQFQSKDPVIQSWVQQYYTALLDALRKVPGLALAGADAQVSAGKPADYRISVAAGGWGQSNDATQRLRITIEAWSGSAFTGLGGTAREVRTLDASSCPSSGAFNCGPVAAAAADVGLFVGLNRLPRYPGAAQAACDRAMQTFAQAAFERTGVAPSTGMSPLPPALERLTTSSDPASRASSWSFMRGTARPETVPNLVTALRETTSETFRRDVVTLLAVKFSSDPGAREALAAIAAAGTDTLTRRVAERALSGPPSGDGAWVDYVVAGIHDASLPAAQRLEALNWMFDVMPLDPQQMSATLATVLTTLQQRDGIAVLARLLVGTQQHAGNAADESASQLGKWVMARLGPLNLPAVEDPAAAVDLLIACFEAMPAELTLNNLAARRDDPRVASKLESIAADPSNPQLAERAARWLRQPLT